MSSRPARSPRAGGLLAPFGIVLLALNPRTAVASLSPVFDSVAVHVPRTSVGIGALGTQAPICFAVFAVAAPWLAGGPPCRRRLAFAAIGVSNVLLPPAVKRFFPDRIGALTAMGAALLAVSTAIPAAVADPVADAAGWRVSPAMWPGFAVIAVLPRLGPWVRERRPFDGDPPMGAAGAARRHVVLAGRLGVPSALRGFLVQCVRGVRLDVGHPAGSRRSLRLHGGRAGGALPAIVSLPANIVVPLTGRPDPHGDAAHLHECSPLPPRLRRAAPRPAAAPWLWISAAGLGPRCWSRSPSSSSTSAAARNRECPPPPAFVQGGGYLIMATALLPLGFLHSSTGEWTAPILLCPLLGVTPVAVAPLLATPRLVEDDLAEKVGASR